MKKGTMEWLEFAKRDLEAAKFLVNSPYLANIVLFHSQQCIEKCLKAYLEESDIKIPKIHSVVKLYAMIPEDAKMSFNIKEDELDLVDLVYIDTRYPSGFGLLPSGFPTENDAEELLAIAEKVYVEITSKM
ncbi:MAG: HEPN domain-containing protein [Deltaproteobacteria bacterium]|nr:HEPN domain-containing protein [Deltaproteobacteria bacterium]